jgi:hypothetical protein
MTANTPLYIHEFSTGINPDGTSESWISRGFTGQYMNSTLPEIPYNVERSIANDEFKVAESVDKDTPSMVGRVVLASGGANDWAVIAVITRGKDEYVRSLTVTRYFLAEGADSLSRIVAWLDFRAKQGRLPVYNPFEIKVVGQPNISTASIVKTRVTSDIETRLKNSSNPLIVSPDSYSFPVLDSLVCTKAELTGQPASWAYNVEALERPERFQIILPASDRALTLIQQALATKPKEQAASAIDEKALKQAIKGLADNPTVKAEQWQTFVENIFVVVTAFPDPDKASDYWQRLFDGQGASNAIKQGIYTQPMIRLLTLRAIALPDTLPNFLQWLQVGTGKKDKSYGEISLEFQKNLQNLLEKNAKDNLAKFLFKGVRYLIEAMTKGFPSEVAAWLFLYSNNSQSLWYSFGKQISDEFEGDLKVIGMRSGSSKILKISGNGWDEIWKDIRQRWKTSLECSDGKYISLADFFNLLGKYKISAHFYQLSYGEVPREIFTNAFKLKGVIESDYGLKLRQQGYNEQGERILTFPIVAAIAVFMFASGVVGGIFIGGKITSKVDRYQPEIQSTTDKSNTDLPTSPTPYPRNSSQQESPATNLYESVPTKKQIDNGVRNLGTTKKSLDSIVNELKKNNNIETSDSYKLIKDILGNPDLDFSEMKLESTNAKAKEAWIKAIYNYQEKNGFTKDGIIYKGADPYLKLFKDIPSQLKPNPQPPANNP